MLTLTTLSPTSITGFSPTLGSKYIAARVTGQHGKEAQLIVITDLVIQIIAIVAGLKLFIPTISLTQSITTAFTAAIVGNFSEKVNTILGIAANIFTTRSMLSYHGYDLAVKKVVFLKLTGVGINIALAFVGSAIFEAYNYLTPKKT